MLVTPNGFAILTSMLSTLAGGKIVLALEVRSFSPLVLFMTFDGSAFCVVAGLMGLC